MNTAVASVLADVTRRVGRGSDLFRYVRHEFYSANKDFDLHDRNGRWVLRARGGVMEFVMDDGHVRGAATHPVRDASDAVPAADGVLGVVRRHAELVTLAECYEALVRHAPLPPDRARTRTIDYLVSVLRAVFDHPRIVAVYRPHGADAHRHLALYSGDYRAYVSLDGTLAHIEVKDEDSADGASVAWAVSCAADHEFATVLAAVARALSDGEDAATDFDAPREGDDLPADRALCELTRAERVYPLSFGDLATAGESGGGFLASDVRRRLAHLREPVPAPTPVAPRDVLAQMDAAFRDATDAYARLVHDEHDGAAFAALAEHMRAATGGLYDALGLARLDAAPPAGAGDDVLVLYVARTKAQLIAHMVATTRRLDARAPWRAGPPLAPPDAARLYPAIGSGAYVARTWPTPAPKVGARPETLVSVLWGAARRLHDPGYRWDRTPEALGSVLEQFAPGTLAALVLPDRETAREPRGLRQEDYAFLFAFLFRDALADVLAAMASRSILAADASLRPGLAALLGNPAVRAAAEEARLDARGMRNTMRTVLFSRGIAIAPDLRHLLYCAMLPEILRRRVAAPADAARMYPGAAQLLWELWTATPEAARVALWAPLELCPTFTQINMAWIQHDTYIELLAEMYGGASDSE